MFPNSRFEILNKDNIIGEYNITRGPYGVRANLEKDSGLPLWFGEINTWLENRKAPKHRRSVQSLLEEIGCKDIDGFSRVTHALSLNDTLWVREKGSPLTWEDVSLYRNPFDETIARIAFEGGLYGRRFSSTSPEFTTEGAYQKCWIRRGGEIFLCKSGGIGIGEPGIEPFSEMYASQAAEAFGADFVPYDAERFRGRIVSTCPLFTNEKKGFVPAYKVFPDTKDIQSILRYFDEMGTDVFRRMIVFDALVLNTDRHAGNYGVLFDTDTFTVTGMAPLFDHNMSLLPYAEKEDFRRENIERYLASRPTRIGTDFNEIAHAVLTDEIKSDLKNMRGFQFDRNTQLSLPEWRLQELEKIVNWQIKNVLQDKRLYIPAVPKDDAEYCEEAAWELSGAGNRRYLFAETVQEGVQCTLLTSQMEVLEQQTYEQHGLKRAAEQFLTDGGYTADLLKQIDAESLLANRESESER